jgi:hypothetical protein
MIEIANSVYFDENLARKPFEESPPYRIQTVGIRVRIGIQAGAWWCNSCVGKTEGSQLIQPNCGYCQIS